MRKHFMPKLREVVVVGDWWDENSYLLSRSCMLEMGPRSATDRQVGLTRVGN